MFTYYKVPGSNNFYGVGKNTLTGAFEFYESYDDLEWKKNEIELVNNRVFQFFSNDIIFQFNNYDITFSQHYLKFNKKYNVQENEITQFWLMPIKSNQLPSTLCLLDKKYFVSKSNSSQQSEESPGEEPPKPNEICPSFFMATMKYITDNPGKVILGLLLTTALIAGLAAAICSSSSWTLGVALVGGSIAGTLGAYGLYSCFNKSASEENQVENSFVV